MCGTKCPRTCQEPFKNCNSDCVEGCFCKPGYLRDAKTNDCVPVESCTHGTFDLYKLLKSFYDSQYF